MYQQLLPRQFWSVQLQPQLLPPPALLHMPVTMACHLTLV
jgi:hypothetical protein